jgi:hypothetical protein
MQRNRGLLRNPRLTSVRATAMAHWRGYHHHPIATGVHHHYRPYYNSYGYYAPRSYGYYGGPRYYGGGPGVTFSFGSGGYRGW